MPDWTKQMTQSFEYYIVDPGTWRDIKRLDTVKSSSISRDSTVDTLGSATIDIVDTLGECYIRIYLITIQNGVREKHPLGTYLVQTPSTTFDGMKKEVSMDAYTPLIELKENPPPLGYSLAKEDNIMDFAYRLVRENCRAPVVRTLDSETLYSDFVSNTDDTWCTFISDLISNAKYELGLDELGRIIFLPKQKIETLQPVWTYTDDNSSILHSSITMDHDLYGVPNVVEVTYSSATDIYHARVVNDDPNSPTSTVSRGREILHRVTNVDFAGDPTNNQIQEYAENLLRTLSAVEYTISYTHAYNGVRIGDPIRLDYVRAGMTDIKAKVISQNIKCESGCTVTEKAVFTNKLWG